MMMQARCRIDFAYEAVSTGQWLRNVLADQIKPREPHTQILHEPRAEGSSGGWTSSSTT